MFNTTALLLTALTCFQAPNPSMQTAFPTFEGGSEHAVIARPLAVKYFEDHGARYWRAQYEVVAWAARPARARLRPVAERVVIEWSCDPLSDGRDVCGEFVERVLPGFVEHATFVQLELTNQRASTFDGVVLFYAAREGARLLAAPSPPATVNEGAHPKC